MSPRPSARADRTTHDRNLLFLPVPLSVVEPCRCRRESPTLFASAILSYFTGPPVLRCSSRAAGALTAKPLRQPHCSVHYIPQDRGSSVLFPPLLHLDCFVGHSSHIQLPFAASTLLRDSGGHFSPGRQHRAPPSPLTYIATLSCLSSTSASPQQPLLPRLDSHLCAVRDQPVQNLETLPLSCWDRLPV